MDKVKKIIPGFVISLIIAILSQLLAEVIPHIGGATIAIILGIFLGNTVIKNPILNPGTHYSEKSLLEYSVVLLGLTISFQTIIKVGLVGFLFIVIQMTITIISAIWIGKALKFNEGIYLLMAGGNAVCGSSAITSIAPVIDAKDEQKEMTITVVNLVGTLLMLTLPIISTLVFASNDVLRGALIGGTIQSVGQVVAGATMVNPATVDFATLFKIMRIILIVVVVFIFGRLHKNSVKDDFEKEEHKKGGLLSFLPWYLLGFLFLCVLSSLVPLPSMISELGHQLSSWFEIIALAAIGLRLDLKEFMKSGKKFAIYGLSVGFIQVVVAVLLIFFLLK